MTCIAEISANTANKLPRQARVSNHDHHEQTAVSFLFGFILFCFVLFVSVQAIELWLPDEGEDAGAAPAAAPLVRAVYCGNVVLHAAAVDERGFCSLEAWEEMLAPLTTSEVVQSGASYVAKETLLLWLH